MITLKTRLVKNVESPDWVRVDAIAKDLLIRKGSIYLHSSSELVRVYAGELIKVVSCESRFHPPQTAISYKGKAVYLSSSSNLDYMKTGSWYTLLCLL